MLTVATGSATGYTVTAKAPVTGNTFTIVNAAGAISRTCSGTSGGCSGGSW
jgi:hypothetical protein